MKENLLLSCINKRKKKIFQSSFANLHMKIQVASVDFSFSKAMKLQGEAYEKV